MSDYPERSTESFGGAGSCRQLSELWRKAVADSLDTVSVMTWCRCAAVPVAPRGTNAVIAASGGGQPVASGEKRTSDGARQARRPDFHDFVIEEPGSAHRADQQGARTRRRRTSRSPFKQADGGRRSLKGKGSRSARRTYFTGEQEVELPGSPMHRVR